MPEMRALVERTKESASFNVRQNDERLVLFRVDSPQLLRDHARTGDLIPLDRGAGGRVLLAFSGAKGKLYDQARNDGYVVVSGDRVPGLSGVAAPVWNSARQLAGALTLSCPDQRLQKNFIEEVCGCAARISELLGGRSPEI